MFVSISTSSMPAQDRPVVDDAGAERQGVPHPGGDELLGGCRGLVVQRHGAVAVQSEPLAGAVVAVDRRRCGSDARASIAVVVAVDGEDGPVLGGDRRGVGDDVLAELVLGEPRAQRGGVGRTTSATKSVMVSSPEPVVTVWISTCGSAGRGHVGAAVVATGSRWSQRGRWWSGLARRFRWGHPTARCSTSAASRAATSATLTWSTT